MAVRIRSMRNRADEFLFGWQQAKWISARRTLEWSAEEGITSIRLGPVPQRSSIDNAVWVICL